MNKRAWLSVILVLGSVAVWIQGSDVVDLVVRNQEVLFGRYSRAHFGSLLLLTLLLWLVAGPLWATRHKPVGESLAAVLMTVLSTTLSLFVLVVGSGFFNKPRYVEKTLNEIDAETGIVLSGVSRHRPPKERYELIQADMPEQLRSYPDAPEGYPAFPVVLTTDANGFRNADQGCGGVCSHYDVVAVGDSFVAGSQVSDEQMWTELLRKDMGASLYNLGVSGTAPQVYLNNFVQLGRKFTPKTVLLMLYEGNDFRDAEPLKSAADVQKAAASQPRRRSVDIGTLAQASPVTKGLKRLSAEVFSAVGSDSPLPEYTAQMGWMPVRINTSSGSQFYSFDPKRLVYLNNDPAQFSQSSQWRNVRAILEQFTALAARDHFRLVLVYAPSAPHVVMPLVQERIPADALLRFVRYADDGIGGDANAVKQQLFARLDTQENAVMDWCREQQIDFISTTVPLRAAAAAGRQVYFTYDQHWTPDGNAVVADVVSRYLKSH